MSLPATITGVQVTKGTPAIIAAIPTPAVDGAKALIKVTYAPINPADVMWLQGMYPAGKANTAFAGLEGAGVVVAVGPDADKSLVGKRVCFFVGGNDQGTWSNYVVIPSASAIPLPDAVSDEQAACALVNPLTVELFLLECEKAGHSAIVHGAASSALGLMLIAAAKKVGTVKVINLVRRAENVALVQQKGGEYVVDTTLPDWETTFATLCAELKPSAFFDPIGGDVGSKVLSLLPNNSTTYNYGALEGKPAYTVSIPDILFKGKVLRGMWVSAEMQKPGMAPILVSRALGNLAAKTYETTIYKKYPLLEYKAALVDYAANASKGKVLLVPSLSELN